MNKLIVVLLCVNLMSCGTIRTVPKQNFDIGYELYGNQSKCKSIPRVYSGVSYDFCRFHAKDNAEITNALKAGFFTVDILLFSPVADTLLLPVTIVQQVRHGSAEIYTPKH